MREKYIDIMRGIAMVAIMSVHLPQEYIVVKYGLSFMVPTFFIVSGFFLKVNDNDLIGETIKVWYNKSAKKLILAYVGLSCWSVIIITAFSIIQDTFSISFTISLVYQAASGLGILTLWFLPALILGEIIVIVPWKSEARRSIIITGLTLVNLFLAKQMTAQGIFGKACFDYRHPMRMISINLLIVLSQGIVASFFINLGRYMKPLLNYIKNFKIYHLLLTGCVLEVAQLYISESVIADIHYMNMVTPVRFMVAAILGVLAIAIISMAIDKINKGNLLAYIGKNSLFIMGTHHNFMLTALVGGLMSLSGMKDINAHILKFLIALGILIFIDLVLLRICNTFNLTRYLFFDIRSRRFETKN